MDDFLRQAVLPRAVRHWTSTTLREKLIKIGAKVVRHARQGVFQMAEVAGAAGIVPIHSLGDIGMALHPRPMEPSWRQWLMVAVFGRRKPQFNQSPH
jgi:hypothetical protein